MRVIVEKTVPATLDDVKQGALEVLASAFGVGTPDYARGPERNDAILTAAVRIVELAD